MTGQGFCCFEDCTLDAKWSGYCEGHYLDEFGGAPADQCVHGHDPNHVPCSECRDEGCEGCRLTDYGKRSVVSLHRELGGWRDRAEAAASEVARLRRMLQLTRSCVGLRCKRCKNNIDAE